MAYSKINKLRQRSQISCFLAISLTAVAALAVDRRDRPGCLPGPTASVCSIMAGSTDHSGFVRVKAQRGALGAAGQELATILFKLPRIATPECSARPDSDEPAVEIVPRNGGVSLVLKADAKLPASMRWFYMCK